MEGGTDELAKSAVAEDPIELDKQPYDDLDVAVIRATQGDLPVVPEPYAPAAAELGIAQEKLLEHMAGMQRARPAAPRRRDPVPPPRRLHGQRHGRLEGARRADRRARPADGLLPRHLALLPAPDLRGLAVLRLHDGPRPLQGGVRRDPRRDRRRVPGSRARDAVLARPSSRRSASSTSPTTSSAGNAKHALAAPDGPRSTTHARPSCTPAPLGVLPGGVNSPVRAMRSIGRDPIFVERGEGAELVDVDGNRYVDCVCSWGPLIHGHAHPGDRRRRRRGRGAGRPSARRPRPRSSSPRRSPGACPSVEMVRMTSSGTEASMSAVRLARAATGRDAGAEVRRRLPRPRRRPAGRGRLGPGHGRDPGQPRRPGRGGGGHGRRAVERPRRARSRAGRARVRRDPGRALSGQHGASCRRPTASWNACGPGPTPTARCSSSTR